MPLTTREHRQSALTLLLPFQTPAVEPDPGLDAQERQAAAWMYSGIGAGLPVDLQPIAHLCFTFDARATTATGSRRGQVPVGVSRGQHSPAAGRRHLVGSQARRQEVDVVGGTSSHAD